MFFFSLFVCFFLDRGIDLEDVWIFCVLFILDVFERCSDTPPLFQ